MGEGVLQIRMSALFGAKNFVFLKFMVCPQSQGGGGLSQCGQGGGQFVQMSFMDGP